MVLGGNPAWSTMVQASAVRPDIAQPRWVSIFIIFSMEDDSRRGLDALFDS